MIIIVNGDLLKGNEDIKVHQVNLLGVMGRGIALQIKSKYPEVFDKYRNSAETASLGDALIVETYDSKYIANVYSQNKWRLFNKLTHYKALTKSLLRVKEFAKQRGLTVALPYRMASTVAGYDWDRVYAIIEEIFYDYELIIYK